MNGLHPISSRIQIWYRKKKFVSILFEVTTDLVFEMTSIAQVSAELVFTARSFSFAGKQKYCRSVMNLAYFGMDKKHKGTPICLLVLTIWPIVDLIFSWASQLSLLSLKKSRNVGKNCTPSGEKIRILQSVYSYQRGAITVCVAQKNFGLFYSFSRGRGRIPREGGNFKV